MLSVARIAGIMAAKRTSDLVPLCHPIMITFVGVELQVVGAEELDGKEEVKQKEVKSVPWAGTGQDDAYEWHKPSLTSAYPSTTTPKPKPSEHFGSVSISATVSCDGKTGVEMEALTAASVAAMTVYDMCKAVDKGMIISRLRVVRKEGGKSGTWVEGVSES